MIRHTVRGGLSALLLVATMTSSWASTGRSWVFNVYLDDSNIGQHTFAVDNREGRTHVKIDAAFDVKFLFINAYSYRHDNYEVWQNDCLQSIRSRTDDNGELLAVSGRRQADRFYIESPGGAYTSEGCVRSFAYWDPAILQSRALLNAQTGEILTVQVQDLGEEVISIRHKPTGARHYRLVTDSFVIDLWYSKNNEWLALNSTTADGSVLRYEIQ